MPFWTFISARPTGFILVKRNGNMYLKATESIVSSGVGGDELDIFEILKILPGESECLPGGNWEITNDGGSAIVFEMVGNSDIDWGVPYKMTIVREELEDVARMYSVL